MLRATLAMQAPTKDLRNMLELSVLLGSSLVWFFFLLKTSEFSAFYNPLSDLNCAKVALFPELL